MYTCMYMYMGGGGGGGGGRQGGINEVWWKERERITEVEGGREGGTEGITEVGGKEGGREEPNGICVLIHWV